MPQPDTLSITTPADGEMASVLRAVAMSVASSSSLTVDRVQDIALAVNEAFRSIVSSVAGMVPVSCRLEAEDGRVEVTLEVDPSSPEIEVDGLGTTILSGITDRFQLDSARIGFVVANR